jgi:hypothetical protein
MDGSGFGSAEPVISGEARAENPILFSALAGLAAIFTGLIYTVLAVCYLLMVRDPGYGFRPSADTVGIIGPSAPVNPSDDPDGTLHITFMREGQAHFFRENKNVGVILAITGRVRSNYEEPRSFIRLKGYLLSTNGEALADRVVYAGNMLSEKELTDLPLEEITARLLAEGGHDGANVDIQPETEIPFMVVFDKLPDGLAEYRIDALSSQPAR